jgi:sugar lactone lactonase YvrE
MDISVTVDGNVIYVADPDAHCVHRYDLLRARYWCLESDPGEPQISPVGVTVSNDGQVYASDPQLGLIFFAGPADKELKTFAVSSKLEQPTGIHWVGAETEARLYVTDTATQSVLVFDSAGNLANAITGRGANPGQFNYPTFIWTDDDKSLLVTDSLNFRIQRFDEDHGFLHQFGENGDRPGDFSRPKGVATDSFGHVYVVDALMHTIQIFDRLGQLLLAVGGQGQKEGEFWLPNGIFITRDDKIFVADSYNGRVQVFQYVGPGS